MSPAIFTLLAAGTYLAAKTFVRPATIGGDRGRDMRTLGLEPSAPREGEDCFDYMERLGIHPNVLNVTILDRDEDEGDFVICPPLAVWPQLAILLAALEQLLQYGIDLVDIGNTRITRTNKSLAMRFLAETRASTSDRQAFQHFFDSTGLSGLVAEVEWPALDVDEGAVVTMYYG